MTNERAIELLHRLQDEQFDGIYGDERREALSMAVRALEPNLGQKTIDCIIERLNGEDTAQPTQTNADSTQSNTLDCVSRKMAIDAVADGLKGIFVEYRDIAEKMIGKLPSAQPTYTDEEIQKMQDLEQAEIEKAYQLGYEEGKKDAQPEQKMGRWIVKRLYVQCSVCGDCFPLKPQNYCPSCGARMEGESE